ncbi:MAG: DUF4306 domain-containing protein [Bacillota bacterium]
MTWEAGKKVGSSVLIGLAVMFFCIGTFGSWYEGSDLVDDSFEWESTAIFTSWLNDGEISRGNISQIDFFIYSLKFKPTFPIVMMLSFVYIVFGLGRRLWKGKKVLPVYLMVVAMALVAGAILLAGSQTEGAERMKVSLKIAAGMLFLYAALNYIKIVRKVES